MDNLKAMLHEFLVSWVSRYAYLVRLETLRKFVVNDRLCKTIIYFKNIYKKLKLKMKKKGISNIEIEHNQLIL